MAVFTAADPALLAEIAERYALDGPLVAEGISQGVENSNHFIGPRGRPREELDWVLTILESEAAAKNLDFVIQVQEEAHRQHLPVPVPLRARNGQRHVRLAGKIALVTPRMPGSHRLSPDVRDCGEIGRFLGRLHAQVRLAGSQRADPRGLEWVLATVERLQSTAAGNGFSRREADFLATRTARFEALPGGICHGDLFRDNALFRDRELVAVIDWYNTGHAPYAYDLAIVLNDWCLDARHALERRRTEALLGGYLRARPLSEEEQLLLPALRRWAGLRFWASRTCSMLDAAPQPELYRGKNPDQMREICERAAQPDELENWKMMMAGLAVL